MELSQIKVIVNVVEVEPCVMKLQLELPAERADATYRKVRKAVASKAALPGFRAGKVPQALLQKHFGGRILAEAIDGMVQESYKEGLAEAGLAEKVCGAPRLDGELGTYKEGEAFKVNVIVEVFPTIKLPEYKGLSLTKEKWEVTDADVEKQVNLFCDMGVSYEEEAKPAELNDMLQLSYEATLPEGMEVSDKSHYLIKAENTWLALREPEMLPGCSSILQGISAGEERDATVTFPEDFNGSDELKGKSLQYHFSVKSVRAEKRPAADDELAKRMGFESIDKMREAIRAHLENEAKRKEEENLSRQVVSQLSAGQDFPMPPSMLADHSAAFLRNSIEQRKREGASEDDIKAQLDGLKESAKGEALASLREYFILSEIAEKENVQLTNQDIYAIAMELQRKSGAGDGKANLSNVIKEKQKTGEFQRMCVLVRNMHAIKKVIEFANVTEVPAPVVEA